MNRLFHTDDSSSAMSSPFGDSSAYTSPFGDTESDSESPNEHQDLVLARLLRHACSGDGPLADSVTDLVAELAALKVISPRAAELATSDFSGFDKTFYRTFKDHMVNSKIPVFWKKDRDTQHTPETLSSRYLNDFEELRSLGRGGFGEVVLCKNKLDQMLYAVKKIPLKNGREIFSDKISREVAALSRLQHRHVVRYYQAWFEVGFISCDDSDNDCGSSLLEVETVGEKRVGAFLYIQMEFCPTTLDDMLDTEYDYDEHRSTTIFRQIVAGLAYIHAQHFIHRDLTPKNIFFDAHSEIKIGDFGLVKFLKPEESTHDLDPARTVGVSDGSGSSMFGTFIYNAPEIEEIELIQSKITEKVDIYSLGIIFLELMHPFSCISDRIDTLTKLKKEGIIPEVWASNHPQEASLVSRMISSDPSLRPSARELLEHLQPVPSFLLRLQDDDLRQVRTY